MSTEACALLTQSARDGSVPARVALARLLSEQNAPARTPTQVRRDELRARREASVGLLEMSADELLVQIEAAAATGSTRAERMLVMLLDEEARTGSQTLRRNESPRIIGTSDRR